MAGKLTTHVLDTAHGCPAANLVIELWSIDSTSGDHEAALRDRVLIKSLTTNQDGRTDEPLLINETFKIGLYELVFIVGDYFANYPENLPQPLFLNRIPIQFAIADPDSHYHVPLLVSPWSYSTYRGS
jgi:5-hydroxyisourate hydrolase